jgi:membrane-associated phospholipid phosphatase
MAVAAVPDSAASSRSCRLAQALHPRLGMHALAVAAFLLSVAAFALLAEAYTTGDPIVQVDAWLANALHENVGAPTTGALTAITTLGGTPVLALVAGAGGGYLVGGGRRRDAALLAVALIGSQVLTSILKATFERPRPSFDDPVATAGWFSFPSGHALSSIALYGALAYVLPRRVRSIRVRALGLGGVVLLVVAIGFSRLYLGVHYLTDVLAGYSIGLAWLLLAIWTVRRNGSSNPAPTESRWEQLRACSSSFFACRLHCRGKEGVDGSSPSEGFRKSPGNRHVVLPAMARFQVCAGMRRVHFGTGGHSRTHVTSRDTV